MEAVLRESQVSAHRINAFISFSFQQAFNDFLISADIFCFNPVPSYRNEEEDGGERPTLAAADRARQRKIDTLDAELKLKDGIKSLEVGRGDDESVQRDLVMKKLQLWCIKSTRNLDLLSRELQILAHRRKLVAEGKTGPAEGEFKSYNQFIHLFSEPKQPLKTFVIPKADERKKVFGMGYPSAPTQTVNEWYDHMVEKGRMPGPSAPTTQTITADQKSDGEIDDDDEETEEQGRQKRISKDDYLDSHRKGWGNTYGKG
jgi:immunoglobulin-binding protein 1